MLNPFIKKIAVMATMFTVAFLLRTYLHIAPNVEYVTTAMVLTAAYFGRKNAFILTLLLILTTDIVLGNSRIYLFTWTGFLIPSLFLSTLSKKFKNINFAGLFTGLGLGTNMFFYLWTNFGVWLLDTWGMYPKTLLGLLTCYINGLPFLRNQLVGTLVFIPVTLLVREMYLKFVANKSLSIVASK